MMREIVRQIFILTHLQRYVVIKRVKVDGHDRDNRVSM